MKRTRNETNSITGALLCGCLAVCLLPVRLAAQTVAPTLIMEIPAAQVKTIADQQEAASNFGAAILPQGVVEIPVQPGMNADEYKRQKDEMEQRRSGQLRPLGQTRSVLRPSEPLPDLAFEGLNEFESPAGPFLLIPPDTHGAAGKTQFVEIVNSALAVFDKETGARLKRVSLNDFFGHPPPPPGASFPHPGVLTDPRLVYDRTWNRWLVTAVAFPASSTEQLYFIGVSLSDDATGPFFIYRFNVTLNPGELWDFPQVGMDQDAVIITANVNGPRFGTDVLPIAKARLYNGLSLRIPRFTSLPFNTGPVIVLDDNSQAFLLTTRPGTSILESRALTNSSRPGAASISAPAAVNVGLYGIPPDARQPGTTFRLDTLDARFQNASAQVGSSIFNVHTIDFLGFATPRWYEIDTSANSVVQSGIFFSTSVSDDFNPSLTVNERKDVFVTWSSTNPGTREEPPYQAQIRTSGRLNTDPPGQISAGSVVFESPIFYTDFRWGDYSAMTIDPTFNKCAWGVNEKIISPNIWGSFIFRTCFPQSINQ